MKLSLALIMAASANKAERKAERTERRLRQDKRQMFTPERFVYQFPICESIDQCVDAENNPECDGQLFTDESGSISHRGYGDYFNCRWEIKADEGNHVGLKFFEDFDLEWHAWCGFDRVHIRCLDDSSWDAKGGKPISRLCGPKNRGGEDDVSYGYDALKIMPKNSFFKASTSTNCNHVLIEFNTDQDTGGMSDYTGFTLGYYQQPGPNPNPNPCNGKGIFKVSSCLTKAAIEASKAEYQNQIDNSSGKLKRKLVRTKAIRLANAERHVNNYMTKMMSSIARCGRGFSAEFTDAFYNQMKQAARSNSAEEMFAIWNLFATQTMTGEGSQCKWYVPQDGAESIEESSFPCRTRRLFLKMLGQTQYGQYTECQSDQFDIDDNVLFR